MSAVIALATEVRWQERRFTLPMERILLSERVGYDAVFTAEGFGSEGLVPLGYIAGHTRHLKLGTRIVEVTGRVPSVTAMAFQTLYYGCGPLLHVKEKSLFKGSSVLLCVVTMGCLYPLVVPRWGALGAAIVYMLTVGSYSVFLTVVSFRLWAIFTGGRRFLVSGLLLMAFLAVAYFIPASPVLAHYSYAAIIGFVTFYLVTRTGFLTDDESAALAAAAQWFRSALPGWGN